MDIVESAPSDVLLASLRRAESGGAALPVRPEARGEPIPGYRLIERLGRGGFGEVWKAEAPGGLLKAIKFVFGDLETAGADGIRAEQELKSLTRVKSVRHPYILSLERFDIIDGQLVIVMELADRSLWDRFNECRAKGIPGIPRDELLRYMQETAEALDLMNGEHQLQHLDIKPQNIFLVYNHVKVADFGLVKALENRVTSVTGGVTPIYAAPEMYDGWVSRYCDQYSLAIVYQEMLTGRRPYSGTSVHQLVMQHLQGKPELAPLPPRDREAIARALAKKPEDRFPSCTELVQELLGAKPRPGPVPAAPAVPTPPTDGAGPAAPTASPAVSVEPPTDIAAPRRPASPPDPAPRAAVTPAACPMRVEEMTGRGELMPALVVGLGGTGRRVLRQLREAIADRFASCDDLPHVRLLYVDTDTDGRPSAGSDHGEPAALGREAVLARLGRASHYLKPRDGRTRVGNWFNPNVLYRMQRGQVTGGLRSLGRLAFFDHYRTISQRLRGELEACRRPGALAEASRRTGLELRTNRPRVYVVAGLGGGTGGGMFIDLAYTVRRLLQELGHASADVVGVLLLPPDGTDPAARMALGNAHAALIELYHFSCPDTTFSARYDDREGPVQETRPPFDRCVFFPEDRDPAASRAADSVGQFLFRDLVTPLGRAADAARTSLTGSTPRRGELRGDTFGLCRFAWPRRTLIRTTARGLCRQILRRWLAKDADVPADPGRQWLDGQWTGRAFGPEAMITRFQSACEQTLGQPPEAMFASLVEPIEQALKRGAAPDADAVLAAWGKLERLVGYPGASALFLRTGAVEEILRNETDAVIRDWRGRLVELGRALFDQPDVRFANFEESQRLLIARIGEVVERYEPLCKAWTEKAAIALQRLRELKPGVAELLAGGRRTAALRAELVELLQAYPKWRYQALVLGRILAVFSDLKTFASDQLRELALCRPRLLDLLRAFESADGRGEETPGRKDLYPAGCSTAGEAAERFIRGLPPEDLAALERRALEAIHRHFPSLPALCASQPHLLAKVGEVMQEEAATFAGERLAGASAAELFLVRYSDSAAGLDELAAAFDRAAPRAGSAGCLGASEFCLVTIPGGPQEAPLRRLAERAVPSAQPVPVAGGDDIVLYREQTQVPVSELSAFGPVAREAYEQFLATEHLHPHSRLDVGEWRSVEG